VRFLQDLDHLSEAQTTDSIETPLTQALHDVDVSRLNMLAVTCLERLPPLIEMGSLSPLSAPSRFNFPYHPPSAYSEASTAHGLMPQSIGYVLLQVSTHGFVCVTFLFKIIVSFPTY